MNVVWLSIALAVAKVLHEPTINLKDAAGTARGDVLAEAFRDLFGVGP